jgi:hypothetical protein
MTDPFARIAGICLDIGIIVLVFVSLFWDAPAFKTHETPAAAPEARDAPQADMVRYFE